MSSTKKTSSFSFRYNPNEKNQLEEVLQNDLGKSSIESESSSTATTPIKVKSSISDNSVKDFITSKLSRGRSLDQQPSPTEDMSASPSSSKWLNESWRKFQQMIEEKKEKSSHHKNKELKDRELGPINNSSVVSSSSSSSSNSSTRIQNDIKTSSYDDNDLSVVNTKELHHQNSENNSLENSDEKILNLSSQYPISPKPPPRLNKSIHRRPVTLLTSPLPVNYEVKPLQPSPQQLDLWQSNKILINVVGISSAVSALIAVLVTNKLPFPSFFNGFVLGIIIAFISFGLLILYILYRLFDVSDSETISYHEGLLKDCSPIDLPSPTKESIPIDDNSPTYKEWFYELVTQELNHEKSAEKCEKSDKEKEKEREKDKEKCEKSDEKPKYKTHLIFVRLQGNYLRLSEPHCKNIKLAKLTENSHTSFINQRHYDLLGLKRIYLWLPNSVRDRKKYLWCKKYPIVLEVTCNKRGDQDNPEQTKIARLTLFSRTNRAKEQWYWRFREASRDFFLDPAEELNGSDDFEELIDSTPQMPDATPSSLNNKYEEYLQELLNPNSMSSYYTSDDGHILWFNAILGRIFFEFLNSQHWSKWLAKKIQRKLSRIKLPYFMQTLTLKDIKLGPSLPRFKSAPKHPMVAEDGLWIDFQVDYSGGFAMTLETKLNLMRLKDPIVTDKEKDKFEVKQPPSPLSTNPLEAYDSSDAESIVPSSDDEENNEFKENDENGAKLLKFVDKIAASKYFQQATDNKYIKKAMEGVSNTPLLLEVYVQELSGILSINFPPPPSDRLWYGFRGKPNLVLTARPCLGNHAVSTSHVIEWIQKKLQEEFCKLLVIPNMDDIFVQVMMAANSNIDLK